ncbi:MAG: hypothetical protein AAGC96_15440, partial [Pseudomonadota bacterium]
MTRKQIVLLQPHLASLDGHEHTQIKALEWLLPQHRLTVVTRQGCALAKHFDETQLLQLLPQKRRKHLFSGASAAVSEERLTYCSALEDAIAFTRISQSDLLLVPSAGPEEIAAMVDSMEQRQALPIPLVKLRILSEDVVSRLDGPLTERLRDMCAQGRIVIYTETSELRQR